MTGEALAGALDRLPKVELHCHIEGTMRPSTVLDLAHANGVALPTEDLDELYRYSSLDEFLSVFWLVQSCLQNRGDWVRLAHESVVDAAAHGRVYAETFFTPARHLAAGAALGDIVAGLDEGIAAAEAETGTRCMLVADIDRAYGPDAGRELVDGVIELQRRRAPGADRIVGIGMDSTELGVDPRSFEPAYRAARAAGLRVTAHQGEDTGPDAGRELVDGVIELQRRRAPGADRIVGIGMDSTELGVDPRSFEPAYAAARAAGLRVTAHQGEDTGPDAIAACVDVLGAERIDHGLSIMGDGALVERFAGEGIPLTVCPTSNIVIANRVATLAEHPFRSMREAGLLATLNTDDPALTDLDLGREYAAVAAAYHWSFDEMVAVAHDGVDATWLDDDGKRSLHVLIDARAAELRAELPGTG